MSTWIARIKKLLITLLLLVVVMVAWNSNLDAPAKQQVDAGFDKALAAFAVGRGLNAVISMAQGTQVSVSLGAGFTLSIGEVLDPINDLIEQFSNLMLMATIAFGIQKILLAIGQYQYINYFLTLAIITWGVMYLFMKGAPDWLGRLLVVSLLIRFAIPVATLGTDLISKQFLEPQYKDGIRSIQSTSKEVHDKIFAKMPVAFARQPQSEFEKFIGWTIPNPKQYYEDLRDGLNKKAEDIKTIVDRSVKHMATIIVVFLLQTLIFPLIIVWALFFASKSVVLHPRPN